jgi:hypothetical protein
LVSDAGFITLLKLNVSPGFRTEVPIYFNFLCVLKWYYSFGSEIIEEEVSHSEHIMLCLNFQRCTLDWKLFYMQTLPTYIPLFEQLCEVVYSSQLIVCLPYGTTAENDKSAPLIYCLREFILSLMFLSLSTWTTMDSMYTKKKNQDFCCWAAQWITLLILRSNSNKPRSDNFVSYQS